jgi:hydroxymethylglutaryl-CoA lyase
MIRIIEVGPRDGLQNEPTPVPTEEKFAFIERLAGAGLREIEATSFVSPKWVPQLADAAELWPMLSRVRRPSSVPVRFSALVPNRRGLERALELGVTRIALFTAVSDAFTQANINMTVGDSLELFADLAKEFRAAVPEGWLRGYVSTAFECPYSGRISPERAVGVAVRLWEMGCDEVSMGDTIGVAAPPEVKALTQMLAGAMPLERIAYHFHDTRGTAIANVVAALELGVTAFDASAGGLGGCPYAPGAGGNVATEDLVYLLHRMGFETGVNEQALARASLPILALMGRSPSAKAQLAALATESRP